MEEIKDLLEQAEILLSQWRDNNPQHTAKTISAGEAHRNISEALTLLGR